MTLRTLIRWEQLRGKPYAAFDPADTDDLDALLYVRQLALDPAATPPFGTWRRVLQNGRIRARLLEALRREQEVQAQFTPRRQETEAGGDGAQTMARLAAWLVAEGMDAGYVMDRMELADAEAFVSAFDDRRRQRLEAQRLWTWLGMLPHTGTKPFPHGAADIYRFPWDGDLEARDREIQDRDIRAFQAFMKSGKKGN